MREKAVVIKPGSSLSFLNIRELWQYRDLLYLLTRKEVLVRYKQTVLGPLYAIIQPFLSMIVFTLFFGKIAEIPNDNIPYPLFYYSALVPWTYFSWSFTLSANSLTTNAAILQKVYFPRIIIPLVPCVARIVDFFIALAFVAVFMVYYSSYPGWQVIYLPLLLLIMFLCATGAGLWLTSLNIKYRDVGFAVQFVAQFWMFASPIVYPYSMVPDNYKLVYALNPMTGIIEGFRSILVGDGNLDWILVGISAFISVVLFCTGVMYFNSVERKFADVA